MTTREGEIRARRNAIAPLPWNFDAGDRYQLVGGDGDYVISAEEYGGTAGLGYREHDAEFITNAPADIDYLLNRVDHLWEALSEMLANISYGYTQEQLNKWYEALEPNETTTR